MAADKPAIMGKLKTTTLQLSAALFLLTLVSCEVEELTGEAPRDPDKLKEYNQRKMTIEQGVSGTVFFEEGNCMPPRGDSCRTYPVIRTVRIYAFTTEKEAAGDGPFYSGVSTQLIATATSDKDGFYQAALSPGKYSLFIEEDSLLYANQTDQKGGILVAVIDSGWVTMIHPEITYKAVY